MAALNPCLIGHLVDSKRILFLCTRFETSDDNPYLTNDLVNALAATGNIVQVVALQWSPPPGGPPKAYRQANGVDVLFLSPRQLERLGKLVALGSKWIGSSLLAIRHIRRLLADRDFDLLIGFSPVVTCAFPILWAMRRFRCASYVYVTDFFPFHQRGAGQITNPFIFEIARRVETALLRQFDVIGCMSRLGVGYLKRNYKLRPEQRAEILPLWGASEFAPDVNRSAERRSYNLPVDKPIALFGGQISEGRGIVEILSTARIARSLRPDIFFLLIGRGRLVPLVEAYIEEGAGNLVLMDAIPRDRYLALVAACDVGIVSTIANVDVPTFPSKTIDYLRAGLPVVASVEKTTDYGEFVTKRSFGVAVEAGDPRRLFDAIGRVLDDPSRALAMREAGRRTLAEVFDVRKAAETIIRQSFGAFEQAPD